MIEWQIHTSQLKNHQNQNCTVTFNNQESQIFSVDMKDSWEQVGYREVTTLRN